MIGFMALRIISSSGFACYCRSAKTVSVYWYMYVVYCHHSFLALGPKMLHSECQSEGQDPISPLR